MQTNTTFILFIVILALVGLEVAALHAGINGVLLKSTMAAIGGIGGVVGKIAVDNRRAKRTK